MCVMRGLGVYELEHELELENMKCTITLPSVSNIFILCPFPKKKKDCTQKIPSAALRYLQCNKKAELSNSLYMAFFFYHYLLKKKKMRIGKKL